MLWVAALLSLIVWTLGRESGFLGSAIHIFLLLALLAVLARFLPPLTLDGDGDRASDAPIPPASAPVPAAGPPGSADGSAEPRRTPEDAAPG